MGFLATLLNAEETISCGDYCLNRNERWHRPVAGAAGAHVQPVLQCCSAQSISQHRCSSWGQPAISCTVGKVKYKLLVRLHLASLCWTSSFVSSPFFFLVGTLSTQQLHQALQRWTAQQDSTAKFPLGFHQQFHLSWMIVKLKNKYH